MSSYIVYTSIKQILTSCKTLKDRLEMIRLILSNMEIAMSAGATEFEEYKLDTGQTKNEVRYKSMAELSKSYEVLLDLEQKILSRIGYNKTGRIYRLVDGKNFIGLKRFF